MGVTVEAARVTGSRLVKTAGLFERDFTLYQVLAKVKGHAPADESAACAARMVEKRFSEFESFHETLEPALYSAVEVHRRKAERLMAEAKKKAAEVCTMQGHVRLLGDILRKASGSWLASKNSPEMVERRSKMLTSYLRGAMQFGGHDRVQEAITSFAVTGSKEEIWEPDPDDPNQVIDTIEETADMRKNMVDSLYESHSISAEERDEMLASLTREQEFEVENLMKQHGQTTEGVHQVAGQPAEGSRAANSSSDDGSDGDSDGQSDAPEPCEQVTLELEATESSVYGSGTLVVCLPDQLDIPLAFLNVQARMPDGSLESVRVPRDALGGQILPVREILTSRDESSSAGRRTPSVADRNAQCAPASSEPVVPIGQCLLNRVGGREEERRRIEERSFDDTEIGDNLDAIMNNALGSTAVAESTARSEEPGPDSQDSSHSASPALSSSPSPSSLAASTARAAQASRAASLVSSESTSSEPQTTGDQNLHEEFGQHYRCVRRSIIRQGSSTTSKQMGVLEVGDELVVEKGLELATGAIRLRFDRGWTSKFASSGDPLVVSVSAEELESEATTTVSSQAAASQRSESSQWDQDEPWETHSSGGDLDGGDFSGAFSGYGAMEPSPPSISLSSMMASSQTHIDDSASRAPEDDDLEQVMARFLN